MQKPSSCLGCPLYDAPAVLRADIGTAARIIYIGQNPGEEEIKANTPFVGPSGRTLNRQLFEAKISRSSLYITNQVKCRTPGNRAPTPAEVNHCRPILAAELDRLPSSTHDVVILAGQTAFEANIGNYSTLTPAYRPKGAFMQRIGCVEQRDGRKWIGTIHPAFIMRMPEYRQTAVEHLVKARNLCSVTIPIPVVETTADAVSRHAAAATTSKIFADDVETTRTDTPDSEEDYVPNANWRLELVGFSAIPYHAAVVKPATAAALWTPVWSDPTTIQAEHNGEYDNYYLTQLAPQRNLRWDTMLAYHYLYNNHPDKALKPFCARSFTNLPYYERDLDRVDPDLYCGMDNIATLLCALRQIPQMRDTGMLDTFTNIGMAALPATSQWQRQGLRIDLVKAWEFIQWLTERERALNSKLDAIVGNVNWGSPKQLQELFYTTWGLPQQTKRDKKTNQQRPTTDDDARQRLRTWIEAKESRLIKHADAYAVFETLGELKTTQRLLDYFNRLDRTSWRVHPYFKLHGTKFHRSSSSPNVQNWTKWSIDEKKPYDTTALGSMRSLVVPDTDDDLFIDIDYAQMQLWIYAQQFRIKWLLDVYASGDYLYGRVYEELNGTPFFESGKPKTKKNKGAWITEQELRKIKEVPLGFLFGLEAKSMADKNGWPLELAQRFRREYFARVPELAAAHQWIMDTAKQRGYVEPPPGVRIWTPNPSLETLNCFAQVPEAFKVQQDVVLLERAFSTLPYRCRTVLTVHDSILMNIGGARRHPERIVEVMDNVIAPILSRPTDFLDGFVFRFEAEIGDRWDWGMIEYDKWVAKNVPHLAKEQQQ